MPICKKCGKEIEWVESKKTGKFYPINPGTKPGDENYFHSTTCQKNETKSIAERERVNGYVKPEFHTADKHIFTREDEILLRDRLYREQRDKDNKSIVRQVAFKGAIEILSKMMENKKEVYTYEGLVEAVKKYADSFEKIIMDIDE